MEPAQLKEILDKHAIWLAGDEGGERADLSNSDLRYSNLSNSDLRGSKLRSANNLFTARLNGATGNMAEIKSQFLEIWPLTYTAWHLHIGCERHRITEWWEFDDARIATMDENALVWWKKWKDFIRQAIELSPATPTKNAESEHA
jgi:hypothetical protein